MFVVVLICNHEGFFRSQCCDLSIGVLVSRRRFKALDIHENIVHASRPHTRSSTFYVWNIILRWKWKGKNADIAFPVSPHLAGMIRMRITESEKFEEESPGECKSWRRNNNSHFGGICKQKNTRCAGCMKIVCCFRQTVLIIIGSTTSKHHEEA